MKEPLELPVEVEALSKLNPYVVTVRYDDLDDETIFVSEALELIKKVRSWAGEQIT